MPPKVPPLPIGDDDIRHAIVNIGQALANLPAALAAGSAAAVAANQDNIANAGIQQRAPPSPLPLPTDVRFSRHGLDPGQISMEFRAMEARLRPLLARFNDTLRRHNDWFWFWFLFTILSPCGGHPFTGKDLGSSHSTLCFHRDSKVSIDSSDICTTIQLLIKLGIT